MALNSFKITGLNTHGLKPNHAFVEHLVINNEIIFICEHWLLNAEKYIMDELGKDSHHVSFSPASKGLSGRPFGGNCLLVSKQLCSSTPKIIHDDEHILAVKTILNDNTYISFILFSLFLGVK